MASLTIRSVPEELHERLKARAERNRRSLNAESLLLLEAAIQLLPDEAELRQRFQGELYALPAPALQTVGERPREGPILEPRMVKRLLREHRDPLARLGILKIGLFGSTLRGESRAGSDVDLLVEFSPAKKSYDAFLSVVAYLESLLGRRVDLLTTDGLSPHIGPRILQEAEFVSIGD